MSGHDRVTFKQKSGVNRNIFASFNSDLNMPIGNKIIGVKKFGKMYLWTLCQAKTHFLVSGHDHSDIFWKPHIQDVKACIMQEETL